MADKTLDEVPVDQIPEVQEFLLEKARYEKFKEDNHEYFELLDELMESYNDKLAAAERAVKAKQVSCGPFRKYQIRTRYDADLMYDLLGREAFLLLGGKEETQKVRDVDKARLENNINSGRIAEDVTEQIRTVSGSYRSVSRLSIP